MDPVRFMTLVELNDEAPDHDHWSTVSNLWSIYSTSENLACWRKESVRLTDIDLLLLHDDPDDTAGDAKIESIRKSIRNGRKLPAVVLIHGAGTHHTHIDASRGCIGTTPHIASVSLTCSPGWHTSGAAAGPAPTSAIMRRRGSRFALSSLKSLKPFGVQLGHRHALGAVTRSTTGPAIGVLPGGFSRAGLVGDRRAPRAMARRRPTLARHPPGASVCCDPATTVAIFPV